MSAPGIVMFYACDEINTALLEVAQGPGSFAVGRWRTLMPAIVLDLTLFQLSLACSSVIPKAVRAYPAVP